MLWGTVCRQSAIDALAELQAYAPGRLWRLIQVAGSLEDLDRNKSHLLGEPHITPPAHSELLSLVSAGLWNDADATRVAACRLSQCKLTGEHRAGHC